MGVGIVRSERLISRGSTRVATSPGLTAKRVIDVAVSALLLAVLAPVMVVLALVILVAQGRPILFRQRSLATRGSGEQAASTVSPRPLR